MTHATKLRAMIFTALIAILILVAIFAPLEAWVAVLTRPQAWHGPRGIALFITLYVLWNFALPPAPLQALAGAYYGFFGGLAVVVRGTVESVEGHDETGVSIMRMEAGLDSGPVLHQVTTGIGDDETGGELTRRLAALGAEALLQRVTWRRTRYPPCALMNASASSRVWASGSSRKRSRTGSS